MLNNSRVLISPFFSFSNTEKFTDINVIFRFSTLLDLHHNIYVMIVTSCFLNIEGCIKQLFMTFQSNI